jgi:hypothetical protein
LPGDSYRETRFTSRHDLLDGGEARASLGIDRASPTGGTPSPSPSAPINEPRAPPAPPSLSCACVWLRVAAGGCVWLRVRARHTRPPRSSYRRYHSHPHRPNGAARSFTDLIERGDKRPLSPINGRVMAPVRLTRVNGQTNSSLMLVVRGGDARGARDTPDTSRVARVPAPHHHRRRQRPRLHEGPDNSGDKLET